MSGKTFVPDSECNLVYCSRGQTYCRRGNFKSFSNSYFIHQAPFNHTEELEELPNDINEFYTINTTHSLSIFTLNRVEQSAEYICQYENALGMARKRFSVKTRVRLHTGIVVAFAIMSLAVVLFLTLRLAGRSQTRQNKAMLVKNEKTKLLP